MYTFHTVKVSWSTRPIIYEKWSTNKITRVHVFCLFPHLCKDFGSRLIDRVWLKIPRNYTILSIENHSSYFQAFSREFPFYITKADRLPNDWLVYRAFSITRKSMRLFHIFYLLLLSMLFLYYLFYPSSPIPFKAISRRVLCYAPRFLHQGFPRFEFSILLQSSNYFPIFWYLQSQSWNQWQANKILGNI